MNEQIKELAEQAGLSREFSVSGLWLADDDELERFADLVRQDERKACADLVFEMAQLPKYNNNWLPLHHAQSAIRERQDT
jgi:hypothetical protein